jgi:NitT/TauT family transport system permease protein
MKKPLYFFLPVLILIAWEITATFINNAFILPRLESILAVLLNPTATTYMMGTGSLLDNAEASVIRISLGFLLAAVIAIPLGIGMGRSEFVHEFFDSTIQILRPIPPLAWVPLTLAWFKIGITSIVFIIFIGAFFPILLNTIDGVRGIKKTWAEVAMNLGAHERQLMAKVILPAAAPTIWTGLRIGFGVAWMCVIAAEWLPGTTQGLGYLILYAYNFGQINVVVAGMVAIGIIGIAFDVLFTWVDKRWFGWRSLER